MVPEGASELDRVSSPRHEGGDLEERHRREISAKSEMIWDLAWVGMARDEKKDEVGLLTIHLCGSLCLGHHLVPTGMSPEGRDGICCTL